MQDLASLGLKARTGSADDEDEQRHELRLIDTDAFVAWFQATRRTSDGDKITSVSAQLIRRSELTEEQSAAASGWLREQMLALL